jgi:hypothetical protein
MAVDWIGVQPGVKALLGVAPKLTDDLEQDRLDQAVKLLDSLVHPLSRYDVAALFSLLPAGGDTACGLNWTLLHGIEGSPAWPMRELLEEANHEWVEIFKIRLSNAEISRD